MKQLSGGFSNIPGFSSLGKHIGIKHGGKDFAVLFSDKVCTAAAVYTSNQIQGAPIIVNKQHLANNMAQAVVVNSGRANVATGEQGIKNAEETAALAAAELGIKAEDVLVCSTGVIGPQLPMEKIRDGLKGIKQDLGTSDDFADAILTTDTRKKEICVTSGGFTIAGCAKGSGMIAPDMATMLAFIATDADINGPELSKLLKSCVDSSFNMMSVDMDTSTSDTVIIMANGSVSVDIEQFRDVLEYVCQELAKMIARDGEGATKLIISETRGAFSQSDARKVAKSIVTSNLVKTAVYGNDPNWGRLMMALGNSRAQKIEQDKIQIRINQTLIVNGGKAASDYDAKTLSTILSSSQEIVIAIDLNLGNYAAEAYGCDMSEDYIKINAEYTT
ncbi:MAG TPA: bifunctional glutamate N-acetyltransferase/amino-acid acetyltransferase ArgJ [Candidatus Dormibacteraeota bacterium]|nr:bifunctional glutamate N-acetyltransferase/amino-acid acetyltransferase ArgJ [Candidatus Dormibacteraeota bacterium]